MSRPRSKKDDRQDQKQGGDVLLGPEAWFELVRRDASGAVPPNLIRQAFRQKRAFERRLSPSPPTLPGGPGVVNWTPLGPSAIAQGQAYGQPTVSGRVNGIAVGPGGGRVYVGAANGGVWFSADGGVTWQPLDDYFIGSNPTGRISEDSLSVGDIKVLFGSSQNTDLLYVGTGEGYRGVGVRRSSGGGLPGTWTLEATNLAGHRIFRLAIDPDTPALVWAATDAGLYQRPTSGSTSSWTHVTSGVFVNAIPWATDVIVAGTGAAKRTYLAFENDSVYRYDGTTWTRLGGIPANAGRISLAAGESDPSAVYALVQNGSLYRLVTNTFQAVSNPPPIVPEGQGGFDLVIGVDPANADTVYLAGDYAAGTSPGAGDLSLFKGTITGGAGAYSFPFANAANPSGDATFVGQGIHADGHAIAFALNASGSAHDPTSVWVGSDGGLFHSSSSGALGSFVPRNTGLATILANRLVQRSDTDAVLFIGTQDNGSDRGRGEAAWALVASGDGGAITLDPGDPYQVMRQYVGASLDSFTDGNAAFPACGPTQFLPLTSNSAAQNAAAQAERQQSYPFTRIAVSPAGSGPTLVAFATNRLWFSSDWGCTWVTLPTGTNPYAVNPPNSAQDALNGPVIDTVFSGRNTILAATGTTVYRFDFTGGAWQPPVQLPVTGLPSPHFISSLAVDPGNANNLYATLFTPGFNHVWYYDAAASSWQAIGPPPSQLDIITNSVVVDPPSTVYIGTDVGVWKGTGPSPTALAWQLFSQGLPEASVQDLAIHQRARLLRAATYGRGVWEIELDAASGTDPDIYLRVNTTDTGRLTGGTRYAWVEGAPDPTAKGYSVYHWMSPDIKVRRGSLGGPALQSPPDFVDFAVNINDYIDSTTHTETGDITGPNRIFVELHNRGQTGIPGTQLRVLVLLADATLGLPPLPSGYAARIAAGDTSNWVAGSGWRFADPANPYHPVPGILDARVPQIVTYDVDFSSLALPSGHDHVCVAAFITSTTTADQLASTSTDLNYLTMHDKHVAHRNLHLVTLGSRPRQPGSRQAQLQTVMIDAWNSSRSAKQFDVIVQRNGFPGQMSLQLPRGLNWRPSAKTLDGARDDAMGPTAERLRRHHESWHESAIDACRDYLAIPNDQRGPRGLAIVDRELVEQRLAKLKRLRLGPRLLLDKSPQAVVRQLPIEGRSPLPLALNIETPSRAEIGDRYRVDLIQTDGNKVIGGSSYIIAITD